MTDNNDEHKVTDDAGLRQDDEKKERFQRKDNQFLFPPIDPDYRSDPLPPNEQ